MKIINIKQTTPKILKFIKATSKKVSSKVMKFDLVDGQRRSESIARRLMILLLLFLSLYILIDLLVDNGVLKTNTQRRQEYAIGLNISKEKVYAKEVLPDVVENINGDIVTTKASGEVSIVPAEVFMESSTVAVKGFTQSYRGSRIDDKYFALLDKYCSDEGLRTVVAISVAETGMGRDVKRQSNFFGWFAGGNRQYDPSQEVMAEVICKGIEESYMGIGKDSVKAKRYVGGNPSSWMKNFNWAYAQMEVR